MKQLYMNHRTPLSKCTSLSGLLFLIFYLSFSPIRAQNWPTPTPESKPGTRWWWLGSAVDEQNLQWNLREYAKHGIGAVEITPLYGVQGNQANNIAKGIQRYARSGAAFDPCSSSDTNV